MKDYKFGNDYAAQDMNAASKGESKDVGTEISQRVKKTGIGFTSKAKYAKPKAKIQKEKKKN